MSNKHDGVARDCKDRLMGGIDFFLLLQRKTDLSSPHLTHSNWNERISDLEMVSWWCPMRVTDAWFESRYEENHTSANNGICRVESTSLSAAFHIHRTRINQYDMTKNLKGWGRELEGLILSPFCFHQAQQRHDNTFIVTTTRQKENGAVLDHAKETTTRCFLSKPNHRIKFTITCW